MPSENNKDVDDDASFTEEADYEKVDYDSEENEVEYVQKGKNFRQNVTNCIIIIYDIYAEN